MNRFFYSDLVELDSLFESLGDLDLSESEKNELKDLAHAHTHQMVIDAVLSYLAEVDKKKFLELLVAGADDKIWEHLNSRVEKIENKIQKAAKLTKEELLKDIEKVKRGS